MTVLVVEDMEAHAQMIANALELQGHTVVSAASGEEGLAMARTTLPALIITDLRLGRTSVMDGWELIAQVRDDPQLCHIPVIVTAVEVFHDDRERALAAGCNMFLPKPLDILEFLAYAETYLATS